GGIIQTDLPFAKASLSCVNSGPPILSPEGQEYAPGSLLPSSYDYIREVASLETAEPWALDVMDAIWNADVWKVGEQQMRICMWGEQGTTVYKGVCPAAAKDEYDPVVLVRRRGAKTTFIALHEPGEATRSLACLLNEEGRIVCRVSGDGGRQDLLAKQDEPTPFEVDGISFEGTLAFRSTVTCNE
ncbi:MAG: hypothetical protein ACYTGH_10210, partial [Planctomycetota bacterium]